MEQAKTRASFSWPNRFFGTYDRPTELEGPHAETSRWSRPVSGVKAWTTIIVAVITVCGAVATKRMEGPPTASAVRDTIDRRERALLVGQVANNSARLAAAEHRLDAIEPLLKTNLYINCELLRRSQPSAIPPRECSDEQQAARRVP